MAKAKMFPKLFQRGSIGRMKLNNRIIKAPTETHLSAPDGSVTERLIRHYKEVARGGAGLIIVEYASIDNKASKASACQLGVADNQYIAGLSLLTRAIQNEGVKVALQLAHCGRQRFLGIPPIKAASPIPWEELYLRFGAAVMPEELTFDEIQEIVEDFGDAAKRTMTAGFDMVEIHGAHGYLITNFLSPRTNKRTDWYGGSLENRMRILVEIVRDIRAKVGANFPLSVRLSGTEYESDGVMIEDTIETAKAIEKLGVDIIHVSGGNHHQELYETSPMGMPLGIHVWAAEAIKKAVQIPVIASGSITTPELAEDILKKNRADFISLGRPLWADPYWPQKAKEGRPEDIRPCIRCNDGCLRRGSAPSRAILCTVNAAVGDEEEFEITPAERPKKVAVVGGGPAGMEAARVCALRGHEVTLYEKRKLCGALVEASVPEFKMDLRQLMRYFVTQIEKLKIKVTYDEATVDTIKNGGFDALIVAVGGVPVTLDIPGIDKSIVTTALEVLRGKTPPGQRVHIVGGGVVGTEVGLFLAEQGKEVIFTTRQDELMNGLTFYDRLFYEQRLAKQKVTIYTGKRLERVLDSGAVVVDRYGKRQEILADSIVINAGFAPQTALIEQFEKETDIEVYAVGDCMSPRVIFEAVHEGHLAARWV
ncbi:FAD-dependent oxidoreductase [Chloroflexota bacterium]